MTPDPELAAGTEVRLNVPDNPALHAAAATISGVESWGAHVLTDAAKSGRFRALWSEMDIVTRRPSNGRAAKQSGYTGDICARCGGSRMVRNGACQMCLECGDTTGCS